MAERNRHTVVVAVTLAYVLVWGIGVASGLAAMTVVDHRNGGNDGGWAALGMLIVGFVVGVLLGHVAWIVFAVRFLRPFGHTARVVATVVLTPLSIVLLMILVNETAVPWPAWPVTAVLVPALLASWATRPQT